MSASPAHETSDSAPVRPVRRHRPITVDRAVSLPETSSYARYVGRVGALAVTFGVGAALVSMPVAFADTRGSGGSSGSSDSSSSDSPSTHVANRGGGQDAVDEPSQPQAMCTF